MTNKLVNDISSITGIQQFTLEHLVDKCNLCICHDVFESVYCRNDTCEIDIGIGILYIKLEDDMIKYKFIPSKKLEESVRTTVSTGVSPLIETVEDTLKSKVENAYNRLL